MIAPAAAPPAQPGIKDRLDVLLETVSASRLNCWQQCRLKFWFRYVLRLTKPSPPALYVGNIVHSVLQSCNLGRWRHKTVDLGALKQTFHENWKEEQAEAVINWQGEEEAERTTGWALLETYFRETPITLDEKPEAVEVSVEADLSEHGLPKLIGVIDLVKTSGLNV